MANAALGDTGTQGHIVAMSSTNLGAGVVFDPTYSVPADPAASRIANVADCVCNPQVLQNAGYRPSNLQAFYTEVEATIHQNFGYKQQVFMNITNGFPQIGETGRFLGDHLAPPITYGPVYAAAAVVPTDIPAANDTTKAVVVDARNGLFAGGDPTVARSFGVENAALGMIGFTNSPNAGVRCTQQTGIDLAGTFAGSATFPIASGAVIDATGTACPNWVATKEGVAYDKAGGFQVTHLVGATQLDAALWNMTLNTNGLFFEFYEEDSWTARKQSAGGVWNTAPGVQTEIATGNHASATAKSGVAWNALLLARARSFSANANHQNLYQTDPFPASYGVTIASAPNTDRYFFNGRACKAYFDVGTAVRINSVHITN